MPYFHVPSHNLPYSSSCLLFSLSLLSMSPHLSSFPLPPSLPAFSLPAPEMSPSTYLHYQTTTEHSWHRTLQARNTPRRDNFLPRDSFHINSSRVQEPSCRLLAFLFSPSSSLFSLSPLSLIPRLSLSPFFTLLIFLPLTPFPSISHIFPSFYPPPLTPLPLSAFPVSL